MPVSPPAYVQAPLAAHESVPGENRVRAVMGSGGAVRFTRFYREGKCIIRVMIWNSMDNLVSFEEDQDVFPSDVLLAKAMLVT